MKPIKYGIIIVVIILLLLLSNLFSLIVLPETRDTFDINQFRIESKEIVYYIENNFDNISWNSGNTNELTKLQSSSIFEITIIDLTGQVIYSSVSGYDKQVFLKDVLYFDDHSIVSGNTHITYPVALMDEHGAAKGYILFDIEATAFQKVIINPLAEGEKRVMIILIGLVSLLLVILIYAYIFNKKQRTVVMNHLNDLMVGRVKPLPMDQKFIEPNLSASLNTMTTEVEYLLNQHKENYAIQQKFIVSISHELKTPVALIKTYAEALQLGVASTPEKIGQYSEVIVKKADRLVYQIDELFKMTQQQLNNFKMNFKEIYADKAVRMLFEPIQERYTNNANIQVNYNVSSSLINVDIIRIEQVIHNFLDNAIKNTSQDGKITLSAYSGESSLTIVVSDNGQGIKPKDLPKIFDYFYQGEDNQKNDYQGTGLGLAICKYIIDQHHGEIQVKSQENMGSQFSFELPFV